MGPEVIIALQVAGTALSAFSAIQGGIQQKRASQAQATVLNQQAAHERAAAAAEEDDFRRRVRRLQGTQRARGGASGVEGGSLQLLDEDLLQEAELQSLRIRNSGDIRASRMEQDAALARFGGRSAARAGFVRAGAHLVTGLGRVDWGSGLKQPAKGGPNRRATSGGAGAGFY